jgi:hypothetical protein
MNYKKLSMAALLLLLFQGCVSKSLSEGDVIVKAMTSCPKSSDVSIITIPSRGVLADTLMAASVKTTHNDGGFLIEFVQQIEAGSKNIAVQSSSEQKLEAIVANALSGIKDGKLKGISLCLIGISKSEELVSQATRTGATLTMHK